MTKAKRKTGLTDREFNALVDNDFAKPAPARRLPVSVWRLSDADKRRLEQEGAAPGLNRTAARFNAAMARCLGVSPASGTTPERVRLLQEFDQHMREFAKARDIEIDEP